VSRALTSRKRRDGDAASVHNQINCFRPAQRLGCLPAQWVGGAVLSTIRLFHFVKQWFLKISSCVTIDIKLRGVRVPPSKKECISLLLVKKLAMCALWIKSSELKRISPW
jgi:hypothetical protein